MTLGDLQTLVLSWLDDPNAGYFTLPQVTVWLNNAQKEVQKQLLESGENWYVTRRYTTTASDQGSYYLPDDFLKINKLEVVLSGTGVNENIQVIAPVPLTQLDMVTTKTGAPSVYCLKKNCLMVRPFPDQTYTMRLYYSYRIEDMVDTTDVPDVPEEYQEYIALLATFDGFLKDQRDPNPMLKTKADQYIARMKQNANNRNVDFPRMVRETEVASYGYLY